jgi:predicted TIM-barrel fold metal-dependent hydrolase
LAAGTSFEALRAHAMLPIALDIDVLAGAYPDRPEPTRGVHADGVATAAVAGLRAALSDARAGNDEVLAMADPSVLPVAAVDLRDPIGALAELDRVAGLGVCAVRLFPGEQGVEPDFPSVRHIARHATRLGLVILSGGDVRRFWRPYAGLGARVVFLDTHFYHLGDFLLVAQDEPGFHTSTRLLNSPDGLETVAASVGAHRLLFGSGTPFDEVAVPRLRLARSGLSADQIAGVAGGHARALLQQAAAESGGPA